VENPTSRLFRSITAPQPKSELHGIFRAAEAMKLVQCNFGPKKVMVCQPGLEELADRLGATQAGVESSRRTALGAAEAEMHRSTGR